MRIVCSQYVSDSSIPSRQMLIFYGAFYAHRRSKNLLCGCKRKKKYEWKLLILMFWDCWCCKTAFNIADISGNECRNGMLVCLAIEILLWHGNEAINSFHLTVDSILIDRIERNRSFEHIIFVVVLPSKRTQFHSTWILGYCIWCANQIFAKSAFSFPQNPIKIFSDFPILWFAFSKSSKSNVITIEWIAIDRIKFTQLCGFRALFFL